MPEPRQRARPRSSHIFPPADAASPDGLIGIGGELSTEWLLDAYRHGIFPWPFSDGQLAWWSPDPRAVIELDQFHVPRRLARTCRCDRDFEGVIDGCATAGDREHETWITPELREAYVRLHRQGHAHSVETWHEGRLVGGVYGVAIAGLFSAESMFYRVSEASKVALVRLVEHLGVRGYALVDIQQLTAHTLRFGAVEIPRRQYLKRLAAALELPVTFGTM
ncbi:MAG TPA: leucyl/phenylalanyl-tRNA--protein transferase [Pirellulales bacterium]|nr:leucyl/phenylalanyl-tRNA--protein transferase [Pirellulales bacterium]